MSTYRHPGGPRSRSSISTDMAVPSSPSCYGFDMMPSNGQSAPGIPGTDGIWVSLRLSTLKQSICPTHTAPSCVSEPLGQLEHCPGASEPPSPRTVDQGWSLQTIVEHTGLAIASTIDGLSDVSFLRVRLIHIHCLGLSLAHGRSVIVKESLSDRDNHPALHPINQRCPSSICLKLLANFGSTIQVIINGLK